MSGNFTGKTLAAGELSNTTTLIYQSPVSTVTYTKSLGLYNNASSTLSVTLYKVLTGTTYPWYTFVLNAGESADIIEEPLVLSALDSIEGVANVANGIIFTLSGVQEQ